jgi:hypothetical protein
VAGLLHRRARASPEAVFGSRAPRIEVNEAGEEPPIGLVGRRLELRALRQRVWGVCGSQRRAGYNAECATAFQAPKRIELASLGSRSGSCFCLVVKCAGCCCSNYRSTTMPFWQRLKFAVSFDMEQGPSGRCYPPTALRSAHPVLVPLIKELACFLRKSQTRLMLHFVMVSLLPILGISQFADTGCPFICQICIALDHIVTRPFLASDEPLWPLRTTQGMRALVGRVVFRGGLTMRQ